MNVLRRFRAPLGALALSLAGLALSVSPAAATQFAYEREWASSHPHGIAVDQQSNVYVVEALEERVRKFTANGELVTTWGEPGAGPGQFDDPRGIAIGSDGNVYVADYLNQRIQVFSPSGVYIRELGLPASWGPFDVDLDPQGNVYVVDLTNDAVHKFTPAGGYVGAFGTPGIADGQFDDPVGIAVDQGSNLYVADRSNYRIQKFAGDTGAFLGKWGQQGGADGQFDFLFGVDVGPQGNVFVSDNSGLGRVQEFTPSASFAGRLPERFPSPSRPDDYLNDAWDIAVDAQGNAYVADSQSANRIVKFRPVGGPGGGAFALGKLKRNTRKGTAKLTVEVPGPGEVALAKSKQLRPDAEPAPAAGTLKVELRPRGKARRKLAQAEKGRSVKVKVKAKVHYVPSGGARQTESRKLKLVRRG